MPKSDQYTKVRPAGYYNTLLTGDDASFLKLLRKYSISPPDNVHGKQGSQLRAFDVGASIDPRLVASSVGNIDLRRMKRADKIAHIDLGLNQRNQALSGGLEGDMIRFQTTYAVTPGYVPIYFLPWDTAGAAIRLTIPAGPGVAGRGPGAAGGIDATDPYLFFTAAINGCSIFFRGTPQSPTIFHCGGSTGLTDLNAQAEFWEAVMDSFVSWDDTRNGGLTLGGVNRQAKLGPLQGDSIDKRDYIKTPGQSYTELDATSHKVTTPTTARAKSYFEQLRGKHKNGMTTIRAVNPWACVVGRRDDAGDWTFYMQENASIQYHHLSFNPIKAIGQAVKKTHTLRAVARPLILRQIWPNGPGHATVRAGIPTVL